MKWSASATFTKHGNEDFRTRTELRVGQKASHLLGVVIMINPGSSKGSAHNVMVEATIDNTMSIITKLIESAYRAKDIELPTDGYIQICNLFDICEPDLPTALNKYHSIQTNKVLEESPIHCSINSIPKNPPWIWIAWGPEKRNLLLAKAMRETFEKLSGNIIGAKIPGESIGYYHPRYIQLAKKNKPEIRENLLKQIQAHISGATPLA